MGELKGPSPNEQIISDENVVEVLAMERHGGSDTLEAGNRPDS